MENNTVEKSKVIYSAPPSLNIPKKKSKTKTGKKRTHKTESKDDSDVVAAKVPDLTPDVLPQASNVMDIMEGEDMTVADMDIDFGEAGNADADPNRRDKKDRKKKFVRTAAGETWEDPTLAEWDPGECCHDNGRNVCNLIMCA